MVSMVIVNLGSLLDLKFVQKVVFTYRWSSKRVTP